MKLTGVLILIVSLLFLNSCKQENAEQETENNEDAVVLHQNVPEFLSTLKIGLEVLNEPKTLYATKYEKDTSYYVWVTQTSIKALYDDIIIIEFGDYKLNDDGTWTIHTHTDKPFVSDNFNNWYFKKHNGQFTWENCTNATIMKGEEFVDMANWTAKEKELQPQKGIWYFIGENSKGEKVMGYDEYENIPEILE